MKDTTARRAPKIAALAIAGLVALVGPMAATGHADGGSTAKAKVKVKIKTFEFRPEALEIESGTKVVWKNKDEIEHTVTSDDAPTAFDGVLDGKGTKFSVRLEDPGTYEYFCSRHPSMRASIVVE